LGLVGGSQQSFIDVLQALVLLKNRILTYFIEYFLLINKHLPNFITYLLLKKTRYYYYQEMLQFLNFLGLTLNFLNKTIKIDPNHNPILPPIIDC
jgi:hypothetical protein